MTSSLTLPARLRALAPYQPTIVGAYALGLKTIGATSMTLHLRGPERR